MWDSLSPAERDVLLGMIVNRSGPLIDNAEARKKIQQAATKLVPKDIRQLLKAAKLAYRREGREAQASPASGTVKVLALRLCDVIVLVRA